MPVGWCCRPVTLAAYLSAGAAGLSAAADRPAATCLCHQLLSSQLLLQTSQQQAYHRRRFKHCWGYTSGSKSGYPP